MSHQTDDNLLPLHKQNITDEEINRKKNKVVSVDIFQV